jgi:hypothetical protein
MKRTPSRSRIALKSGFEASEVWLKAFALFNQVSKFQLFSAIGHFAASTAVKFERTEGTTVGFEASPRRSHRGTR